MPDYYDLSSDNSVRDTDDGESSSESDDDHESASTEGLASDHRCILHVDVDCFYCQCEIQDRQIPKDKPFAIGQKHIIVTCNYVARAMGVKKLQSRTAAYEACPQLLIIEGSDLERYRIHARKIYQTFRAACKRVHPDIAVRRGSMDEMMADLSVAIRIDGDDRVNHSKGTVYIYGENDKESITLREDQTGACSKIVQEFQARSLSALERSCSERLQRASHIALEIRQEILQSTGFTTTMGVSVNPLLAKIASGLKKPATVNVLFPWRSQSLLASMPLRMIPGVGRTTVKALQHCLEKNAVSSQPSFWTCQDLLSVPKQNIVSCLEQVPVFKHSCEVQADIILHRCIGIDHGQIHDDEGGAPKTVSVENSFRRGTLVRKDALCAEMEELYRRLSRLLQERREWSHSSNFAYPTTIRLTLRTVDEKLASEKRRPFVTRSKQSSFDGLAFMQLRDPAQQVSFLRMAILPLLHAFGLKSDAIDITRASIATTGFQDLSARPKDSPTSFTQPSQSNLSTFVEKTEHGKSNRAKSRSPRVALNGASTEMSIHEQASMFHYNKIDPFILSQLPPDVISELRHVKPKKRPRIDDYFKRV
ncbi:DNA polymerase iota [Fistulifera solaris]|uniref:DNA polymerase iota n=1 Tax=Fistulifera solaris TaxID=1519565 RepID=A0A1Z5JHV9_FISSO|nr:DNA polymerase iota [Fistulifera solaris]|eukprot:GAX13589.1 DNA polymerase iota [Fistulifera solaris]